jgi:hypothetical protein
VTVTEERLEPMKRASAAFKKRLEVRDLGSHALPRKRSQTLLAKISKSSCANNKVQYITAIIPVP